MKSYLSIASYSQGTHPSCHKEISFEMPLEGFPIELFEHVQILVNSYKSGKYAMNNWLEADGKGMDDKSNLASMGRHWGKMVGGEIRDKESGLDHDLHLAVRAMMRYTRRQKGLVHKDDIIHRKYVDGGFIDAAPGEKIVLSAEENSSRQLIKEAHETNASNKTTKMIYLANPYSSKKSKPDEARLERTQRRHLESYVGGQLKKKYGYAFILPIAISASMADLCEFDTGFSTWEKEDLTFISHCDEVWVLKSDGWDISVGVLAEIEFAHKLKIRVRYLDPTTLELLDDK